MKARRKEIKKGSKKERKNEEMEEWPKIFDYFRSICQNFDWLEKDPNKSSCLFLASFIFFFVAF